MHDELALEIAGLPLNHAGAAEILGCSRKTVERLRTKGIALMTTQERIATALERQAEATERIADAVEFRWPTHTSIAREVDAFITTVRADDAA